MFNVVLFYSDAGVFDHAYEHAFNENPRRIFAYFSSWASYRSERGKFDISDIDPKLCDYLLYAFFGIDTMGNVIIFEPSREVSINGIRGDIKRFNELKRKNPSLKTLASIGGDKKGMAESFSLVAASSTLRSTFAINVKKFCQEHGFDGVDIDWEFPKSGDRSNFVQLLAALASELHGDGLILTVAVGPSESKASESYDIPAIARHVDYILLMAYDYNGSWNTYTGHNAPLHAGHWDRNDYQRRLNIKHSVQYWLREGAPAPKLILGVPAFGRTFQLANTRDHNPRDEAIGPGRAGSYTKAAGMLAYYEVHENLKNGWTKAWDDVSYVPYAYYGAQWMSYDDPKSITGKCNYAVDHNLGGVIMWSIDMDKGGDESEDKFPLLKAINKVLKRPEGLCILM